MQNAWRGEGRGKLTWKWWLCLLIFETSIFTLIFSSLYSCKCDNKNPLHLKRNGFKLITANSSYHKYISSYKRKLRWGCRFQKSKDKAIIFMSVSLCLLTSCILHENSILLFSFDLTSDFCFFVFFYLFYIGLVNVFSIYINYLFLKIFYRELKKLKIDNFFK